ncbi:MAG TPA: GTPase HflX [Candidatus Bathyarchaeia archaeon]|nr:GTPase HflX [Candidatus Bathyarchaeia archaeon]
MPESVYYPGKKQPKTLLLGVYAPYNTTDNIDAYFQEFLNLSTSNGLSTDFTLFVKIRTIDPTYFITKGKLEQVADFCKQNNIEHVVISEQLSPQQERNLGDYLNSTILDRTSLILEIFEKAAQSAEGKIQVQMARLQYAKTRLAGHGIHYGQQTGARGQRSGFGETAKEKERRHIENTIVKLKRQLERITTTRHTQRKKRLNANIPLLCLIGYTNAGKSTILNILTKSAVLAEDKLFATLDTTTRSLFIEGENIGLLSDTVGFIQQLPHHLIKAFKSTLDELQYAHLLLHVIDISDVNWESHIKVVHDILTELGIEKDMLYIFNKADLAENIDTLVNRLALYQPHVIISAHSKEKIAPLPEFLFLWKKSLQA